MLAKRIIPCLDVKDGRVVKGVNFANIRDAGDPVALAKYYSDAGADEIVFLDITATHEARKTVADVVARTAEQVFVPLTVGGGIRTVEDFQLLLRAGPPCTTAAAPPMRKMWCSQCIVLAADAKRRSDGRYEIVVEGGRRFTGMDLIDWVVRAEQLGAGEILLTSMDADGTKEGFDLPMLRAVTEAVRIPVIASGGCGTLGHFVQVFEQTDADAALAASLFHFGALTVGQVKEYLHNRNIPVRL